MTRPGSRGATPTSGARVLGVVGVTLWTAAFAHAQSGGNCEELSSWTSSQDRPGGMTFEGEYLWVGSMGAATTTLLRLDPTTGAPDASIPAPGPLIGGLAWDGAALWCLPEQTGIISRLDPVDGTVLHSIPAPSFGDANPNGADLAWDGTNLWHVDYTTRLLYQLDPSDGTVLQSFPTPASLPTGLGLTAGTGAITGTPTAAGTFNFTVQATSAALSGTKDLSITVNTAPVVFGPSYQ